MSREKGSLIHSRLSAPILASSRDYLSQAPGRHSSWIPLWGHSTLILDPSWNHSTSSLEPTRTVGKKANSFESTSTCFCSSIGQVDAMPSERQAASSATGPPHTCCSETRREQAKLRPSQHLRCQTSPGNSFTLINRLDVGFGTSSKPKPCSREDGCRRQARHLPLYREPLSASARADVSLLHLPPCNFATWLRLTLKAMRSCLHAHLSR